MANADRQLAEQLRRARRDVHAAVLEGFHPLKHALRFGAGVSQVVTTSRERLFELAAQLAPDIVAALDALPVRVVAEEIFTLLEPPRRGEQIVALAARPHADVKRLLDDTGAAPIVLLDAPTHLPNVGAVIRTAAAAGAAGVLTTGVHDPWHPAALRGAAGLHFATTVARVPALPDTDRPLIALHPAGEPIDRAAPWPPRAILAFGSERRGLGQPLLDRAHRRVCIPMRAGVSSLSLATAVAVALYHHRDG
jgi:RNA methyltransferase, TrmH family